jgi:hypothetical protein
MTTISTPTSTVVRSAVTPPSPTDGTHTTTPASPPNSNPVNQQFNDLEHTIGRMVEDGKNAGVQTTGVGVPLAIATGAGAAAINKFGADEGTFNFGAKATQQGLRLTPAIASAIVGPAIADGVGYIAPNLMPQYKATMSTDDKTWLRVERAAIGATTVGLGALLIYLKFPQVFTPKESGFLRAANMGIDAMKGGRVFNAEAEGAAQLVRNGVFSNRVTIGLVGGLATAAVANHALGQKDDGDRKKWLGITAGVAAGTVGAMYGMKYLTKGGIKEFSDVTLANGTVQRQLTGYTSAKTAVLGEDGVIKFWKPNIKWFQEFGKKVGMYTAVPAGVASYNNFTVMDAYGNATDPRYRPVKK